MHVPPLGPVDPLLHTQSLTALLPAGESELEGQLLQVPDDVAPTVLEYFPLSHRAHVLAVVAPDVEEYLPAAQLTHDPPERYWPGAHTVPAQNTIRSRVTRLVGLSNLFSTDQYDSIKPKEIDFGADLSIKRVLSAAGSQTLTPARYEEIFGTW